MPRISQTRPGGITALSIFFAAGAFISFTAGLSLLFPNSLIAPMWRVNPRGHQGLIRIGLWGVALLFSASVACATGAVGLWRSARWGHRVAVTLIAINLLSDVANSVLGAEPRAVVGVPIASALLLYLMSKRVRTYFAEARVV